ncbi:MAG: hypothetical protein JF887_14460 [Candidatus Dormibacteraeota bacterium]|uniref:Tetratricopeptide repeat protein n=1 Tax=Candidatus Amunia macphersoniae TaxID=3127014 RepID=A0A934KT22_9BACT|nr:hypothetical protein [Candidatus Dormibacteraeota bacterium]
MDTHPQRRGHPLIQRGSPHRHASPGSRRTASSPGRDQTMADVSLGIRQIAGDASEPRASRMIALNDAVDVLRHGWQEAASTFAPDSPEIAELLQARLEIAVANGALDEAQLLGAIDDVEAMAASAGSTSGQALARRLSRTVYEYLLALDAAPQLPEQQAHPGHIAAAENDPTAGAVEVDALGHPAGSGPGSVSAEVAVAAHADDDQEAGGDAATTAAAAETDDLVDDTQPRRARFGLRRRQHVAGPARGESADHPDEQERGPAAPSWEYAPTTPVEAAETAPAPVEAAEDLPAVVEAAEDVPAAADVFETAPAVVEAADEFVADVAATESLLEPPVAHDATEISVEQPVAGSAEEMLVEEPASESHEPVEAGEGFVAPRAGFHIVEDTHPNTVPSDRDKSPLTMPAFAADDVAAGVATTDAEPDSDTPTPTAAAAAQPGATPASATFQWTRPTEPVVDDSAAPAAPTGAPGAEGSATSDSLAAGVHMDAADEADDTEIDPENGWRVRAKGADGSAGMEEDPFESNPKLADLRRRIDEKLRRKRCDEAAALLQELAQETGGRIVAELAMDAGDRCQSLGKSNAALNCYLAASRADPVYELPLSRLADICIDDQDTELAVSYLERIARLYRFRGDDKAALRVYRRIATIAPYREDVLSILLSAQNTGRFES